MKLRNAELADAAHIREIHLSAFGRDEAKEVAGLAVDLLDEARAPDAFGLLAELEGELVGHIAFSPVRMKADGKEAGFILAPLAVKAGSQKGGVGSELVRAGLVELKRRGCDLVLVYGDPAYYGRFGFTEEVGEAYRPPYSLDYPFGWQGLLLGDVAPSGGEIECVEALSRAELW